MKLTIKTLQSCTFKVEIEPEKTVKELKDKIEAEQGKEYPAGSQKLIYSGKILADEHKLTEYEFDEKKFIVLMITRPPPAVKPPQTKAPEKQSVAKKPDEPTGSSTKSKAAEESKGKISTTQASASTTATTTTTTSSASTVSAPQATSPTTNRPAAGNRAMAGSEPHVASRLAAMMSQPHFRQIQDLIQQSPHLLSTTIEALASSDPEMYNFISDHPDTFVSALNHPPLAGSRMQSSRGSESGQQQSGQQDTAARNTGSHQPVVDQLLGDVSDHDKEAIERLKELGFSEYLAVQAYMACDKDEQLAANLLFQMDQ